MIAAASLVPIDVKSILRDPLLRWMTFLPPAVALLVRWGTPALNQVLIRRLDFDLSPYYWLIMSFLLLLMPMLVGFVIGFLLLDQRDDGTLNALQVTPLGLKGYLAYRISFPMFISLVETFIVFRIADLVEISFLPLLAATVAAAPLAPIAALSLASFAQNKVQGFALMKASGIVQWPIIVAYFVSSWWQIGFGLFPTYWPSKFFWLLEFGDSTAGFYFLAGLGYQILLLHYLIRRFTRVMHR